MTRRLRQTGFPVQPRTHAFIRARAHELIDWTGDLFGPKYGLKYPIVEIIEFLGERCEDGYPDYEVVSDASLPDAEAKYFPDKNLFLISQSVWDAACDGDGHARIALGHEFGHFALGHDSDSFGRQFLDDRVVRAADSEWQANLFADELLMDVRRIKGCWGLNRITIECGVDDAGAARFIRAFNRGVY